MTFVSESQNAVFPGQHGEVAAPPLQHVDRSTEMGAGDDHILELGLRSKTGQHHAGGKDSSHVLPFQKLRQKLEAAL